MQVIDGFRIEARGRQIRGVFIIEDSILERTRLTTLINGELYRDVIANRWDPNYGTIVGNCTQGLMREMSRRMNGNQTPEELIQNYPLITRRRDRSADIEAMTLLTLLVLSQD
jgi:hypothetical protein